LSRQHETDKYIASVINFDSFAGLYGRAELSVFWRRHLGEGRTPEDNSAGLAVLKQ